MMKCWREDPQERPQFAELVKTVEDMLGVGMDYLDLGCLAGVSNREYFLNSDGHDSFPKGIMNPPFFFLNYDLQIAKLCVFLIERTRRPATIEMGR